MRHEPSEREESATAAAGELQKKLLSNKLIASDIIKVTCR